MRKLVDVLTPTVTDCITEELQLDALSTFLSIVNIHTIIISIIIIKIIHLRAP